MSSNKNIAINVLLGCIAGAACSYPLQQHYLGGLVFHGFMAASIGGLADWYAVTALFEKPFGKISWRTEVIPKNKDRLMEDLQDFVCNDLLSTDNVLTSLDKISHNKEINYSKMLIEYLFHDGGLKVLEGISVPIIVNAIKNANKNDLVSMFSQNSHDAVMRLNVANASLEAMQKTIAEGETIILENQLLLELNKLVRQEKVFDIVNDLISTAFNNYKNQGTIRNLALNFADIDTRDITNIAIQKCEGFIEQIKQNPADPLRIKFRNIVITQLQTLQRDNDFIEKANQSLAKIVVEKGQKELISILNADENDIEECIEKYALKFKENLEWQDNFNVLIISKLRDVLTYLHDNIEGIVKEKLSAYTAEDVVTLIRDKVGDDLQLIRVNGSVVGGLVGMLLYIVSRLVEGVL